MEIKNIGSGHQISLSSYTPVDEAYYNRTSLNSRPLTQTMSFDEFSNEYMAAGLDINNLRYREDVYIPVVYIDGFIPVPSILGPKPFIFLTSQHLSILKEMWKRGEYEDFFSKLPQIFLSDVFNLTHTRIPKKKIYLLYRSVYDLINSGVNSLSAESWHHIYQNKPILDKSIKELEPLCDVSGCLTVFYGEAGPVEDIRRLFVWTVDVGTALKYAYMETGKPHLYMAKIKLENILDYITTKGTREIVAEPINFLLPELMDLKSLLKKDKRLMRERMSYNLDKLQFIEGEYFKEKGLNITGHLRRCYNLSSIIGKTMGMTENDIRVLEMSSLLHDIAVKNERDEYGHGRTASEMISKSSKLTNMINEYLEEDGHREMVLEFVKNHDKPDYVGFMSITRNTIIRDKQKAFTLYRWFKDIGYLDAIQYGGMLQIDTFRNSSAKKFLIFAYEICLFDANGD